MATLPTRLQAQASAITTSTLIHIVVTGDTSQSPDGSSYKATLGQLTSLFSGGTDLYITGGTYSASTLTLNRNDGGTVVVTGFTQPFTGNTSGDRITDLYVSNIHSCSPLNINPLDEGNVYFGSTSGVTIDVLNNRLGINNPNPQYILDISGTTGEKLEFQPSGTAPRFLLSVDQSNRLNRVAIIDTADNAGIEMGFRGLTEPTFSGYGKQGDSFVRGGNNSNGLNIMDAPTGSILIPRENYIRFFAGNNANTTPDIHIQGSGTTRGFVGINNITPTERLDVSGKTKTTTLQVTSGATNGYVLTSDSSGNASWQPKVDYIEYRALLTQTGSSAPDESILVDTIGGGIWSYGDVGSYYFTKVGAFSASSKVEVYMNNTIVLSYTMSNPAFNIYSINRLDDDTIEVRTSTWTTDGSGNLKSPGISVSDAMSNDLLYNNLVSIRVWS